LVQLDAAIVTDSESFRVTGQCLEPLYPFKPGTIRPIPALADECIPTEDATDWTCKPHQGVKFHDGTDFNVGSSYRYLTSGTWWAVTFPSLAIMLSVLGFNPLGDGLRDALDPRLTR